jgi:probable rRNA maturation factor
VTDEETGGVVSWSEAALGNGGEPPLSDARVAEAVAAAAKDRGVDALQLDVVFVSAAELAEMHGTYLADPTETDVITFDLRDTDLVEAAGPDGELYVSLERARTEATLRGVQLERELLLYVVHGALHLCGLDDHDESARSSMRAAEGRVMERLGFAPDEGAHEAHS